MRQRPRTVFAQLALVIALVLAGTATLAVLLGRELAARPATASLLHAVERMVRTIEADARPDGKPDVERVLRGSGMAVRDTPPAAARRSPLSWLALRRAHLVLGQDRPIVAGEDGGDGVLWVRLDTQPPLWLAFAYEDTRSGVRRYSIAMLAGCTLLVWLAAGYFARRLTQPLRALAGAAPGLVRGEPAAIDARGAPRELLDLRASLERASREVRERAAERDLMLAGISHDLRTPLTRLQYALALLPDADPGLRNEMERDIVEIDSVLGQFIAYARDGRDEACAAVDLAAICRGVAAAVGGDWQLDLPEEAAYHGRPIALQRAIENLAGNARRHGAAPFSMRLERDPGGWLLEVCDQGPGLDSGLATRAIDPFVRGVDGGSGLGLAIVERVARQHDGQLVLATNVPSGVRARLRLRDA